MFFKIKTNEIIKKKKKIKTNEILVKIDCYKKIK